MKEIVDLLNLYFGNTWTLSLTTSFGPKDAIGFILRVNWESNSPKVDHTAFVTYRELENLTPVVVEQMARQVRLLIDQQKHRLRTHPEADPDEGTDWSFQGAD